MIRFVASSRMDAGRDRSSRPPSEDPAVWQWQRIISNQAYGAVTRTLFRPKTAPTAMRRRFERLATVPRERLQRKYPELRFRDVDCGGVQAESVRAVAEPRRLLVYLHGGAYLFGSAASYRSRALRLSYRCQAEVLLVDYRLAPEHPFPAALDDARQACAHVLAANPGLPVVLAGDSAGGGLTLATLAAMRDAGEPLPAAAFAFSPWTDLSASGASVDFNRGRDTWLSRRHLEAWARLYLGDTRADHPLVSPVHADASGFPPLLMLVGDQEVLLSDTLRMAERALDAGAVVEVVIGRGMQHDYPLALPWLEESRRAWAAIEAFLDGHAGAPGADEAKSRP